MARPEKVIYQDPVHQAIHNSGVFAMEKWLTSPEVREGIANLFKIYQLTEHFEHTTKTGIPDWNYDDLSDAIVNFLGGDDNL
jgi:hypothetical protein